MEVSVKFSIIIITCSFILSTVMPHRVPSPRDLVMHTQSIMQNALIKTKLEEQRENYRKRQEQQQQMQHQQQQRISSPVNSPSKQMMSPTPLAFTPTSVLRKMTAKEEPDGGIQTVHQIELILLSQASHRNNYFYAHNRYNRWPRPNLVVKRANPKFINKFSAPTPFNSPELSPRVLTEKNHNIVDEILVDDVVVKTKYFLNLQKKKDGNANLLDSIDEGNSSDEKENDDLSIVDISYSNNNNVVDNSVDNDSVNANSSSDHEQLNVSMAANDEKTVDLPTEKCLTYSEVVGSH